MSRPQVTITLGRTGQVVKRPGQVSDGGRSDQVRPTTGKRSIRERLGSSVEDPSLYGNQPKSKRQRRDGRKWSPSDDDDDDDDDDMDDGRIGRDDLRFKLMRKNMSKSIRSDGGGVHNMDLREKLSRTEHSTMAATTHPWQRMPDPKANGIVRRIPPTTTRSADNLLHMDSLRKSYTSWTLEGLRRRSPDRILGTSSSRGLSPPRNMDVVLRQGQGQGRRSPDRILGTSRGLSPPRRRRSPPDRILGISRVFSPPRNMDDLRQGQGRRRSPQDRILGTSRALSPPRNMGDLRQGSSSMRPVDISRPPYISRDTIDTSRSTGPTHYMTKPGVALDPSKPVARLPPPSSIMQKASYKGEEPHTVAGLLHSLGLGKYAILFQAEEVDMTALRQMGDNDLKELGIPMGPRKKILLAVMPSSKRLR